MEADVDWIFFAVGVAVIGLVGIGLGLVLGRAVARRAARREGESSAFMTPVGPPESGVDGAESSVPAASPGDAVAPGAQGRDADG
jgi:hypothetical protein